MRVTSSLRSILPSAPPNVLPFFHVPASWKPRRIEPRARSVQRPASPAKVTFSSSATCDQTQQVSCEHCGVPIAPGAVYPSWLCPSALPTMILAISYSLLVSIMSYRASQYTWPTGVVGPGVTRSPIISSESSTLSIAAAARALIIWRFLAIRPPGYATTPGRSIASIACVMMSSHFMLTNDYNEWIRW